jgi:hypothetical protein
MNIHRILLYTIALIGAGLLFANTSSAQDLSNIKSAKPLTLSGNVGVNMVLYDAEGIDSRQEPFTYGFNANAVLTLYSISMPFSLTWYNNKSNFSQPFNQFGFSPSYKWITGHIGYRNLTFSEFTLNGQTFLGCGIELTPGKFRFGAVYGKFNTNSEYDPYAADSLPDYSRKGWAMKIGYGTSENYIDISLLRIGDKLGDYAGIDDSTITSTPKQNMAYGLKSKVTIIKNLSFEVDGAISFYTDDVKASELSGIEDNWLKLSGNFMTINQTSNYYTAIKSALTYRFNKRFSTGLAYRRIDPGYQSMGAYFFSDDMENITINQTAILLKDKLTFTGNLGLQRDNLNNNKESTSKRTIGSANLSYTINRNYAINAGYSNFTTNQKAGTAAIIDSLKLYQTNQSFTFSPRYMKVTEKKSHTVLLTCNYMNLDDKNKTTADQTETHTTMIYLYYILGILPQQLTVNLGINYTGLVNNLYGYTLKGVTAGLSKGMLKNNLSLSWNNSFALNKVNSDKGTVFNTSLSANYRVGKKHSLSMSFYHVRNNFDDNASTSTYNESRGEFSYAYSF